MISDQSPDQSLQWNREAAVKYRTNPILASLFNDTKTGFSEDIRNLFQHSEQYHPDEIPIPFKGNSLLLTNDKKCFVICSVEGRLAIINRLTKECINDVQLPGGGLYTTALPKSNEYVLVAGKEGKIRKFKLSTFEQVDVMEGHTDKVSEVMFSPDETVLYSGSDDKTVRTWDLVNRGESKIIYTHDDRMLTMDLSLDGEHLVTGGADKVVKVYNTISQSIETVLSGPTNSVWIVKLTKSKSMVAGGDNDGVAYIWEFGTWNLLHKLEGHEKRVANLDWIHNDQIVVTSSNDTTVRIWDLTHKRREIVLTGHKNWIKAMLISDDEKYIYTVSEDHRILIWNVPSMDYEVLLKGHTSNIYNTIYSEARNLFYTNANDKKAIVWDFQTKVKELEHEAGIYAMCMTPDEKYLITCTAEKQMMFWDLDTFEMYHMPFCNDVIVKSVLVSPDGKYLITGDTAFRVTVREYDSPISKIDKPPKYVIRRHTNTVWSLAITSDSSILFSGSEDTEIAAFDLVVGAEIGIFKGHTKKVKVLRVSRNNEILVSGSWDSTFGIWSIKTLSLIKFVTLHTGAVNDFYFSKNGRYFISASTDATVAFWDCQNYSKITSLKFNQLCLAVTCNPDEKYMIIADKEDVYIKENPMETKSIYMYGPERSSSGYIEYLRNIISGETPAYDPLMDSWFITPMLINTAHIYAYFNMPKHLETCLANNTPFLLSRRNLTPLDIAHQRGNVECVNVIINAILNKAEGKNMLCFLESSLTNLNYKGYQCLDKLYDNLIVKSSAKLAIKTCSVSQKLPLISLSKNFDPSKEEFQLKEQGNDEVKFVEFYQSSIRFDMNIGSEESINFMDSLINTPNQNIFKSVLIGFILEKKWDSLKWDMRLKLGQYLTLVLMFSLYAVISLYSQSYFNFFIMMGWSTLVSFLDYYYQQRSNTKNKSKLGWGLERRRLELYLLSWFWQNSEILISLLIIISWAKAISFFKLFKGTRKILVLIESLLKSLVSFFIVLFYLTIGFAFAFTALKRDSLSNFSKYLAFSYSLGLGDFDTSSYTSGEMTLFVIATLINPMIMMSLLISIIGSTYDKLQYDDLVTDRKEIAKLILAEEKAISNKKIAGEKKYIHVCTEAGELKKEKEWYGATWKINKLVEELRATIENNNEKSCSVMNELKEKLKGLEKTTEQKEARTKEKADLNKKLDDIEKMNTKMDELRTIIEDFTKRQDELAALAAPAAQALSASIIIPPSL